MSGGGGQRDTTQTTKVEYSPQEQAARDKVMQAALGTYDQSIAKGNAPYAGAMPTANSAATNQGQQMMMQNAGALQGQQANTQAANNFQMHDALYADSNPYLRSAMSAATQPLVQQFGQAGGALSGIRQGAQESGGFGGSRQGIAEGLAAQGLERQVGNMNATMSSDAYNKGLDAQTGAIKNQSLLNMQSLMPAQLVGQVGGMQDAQSQQWANYNADKANYENTQQWGPLQNLSNIIYGGSNGTTTATGTAPKQDNTMSTLGSLGQMAMMMMML